MLNWILIFAISAGQLIKFPSNGSSGATMLDLTIIVLSIYGILKFKSFKKPPQFFVSVLIFIFICTLSLTLTPLHLSRQEFFQSFVYTIRFSLYAFTAYLVYSGIFKINLEKMILISSAIISILGLSQLIFLPDLKDLSTLNWDPHFFRTVSTFLDPNFLGAFLILPLVLLAAKNRSKKRELVLFILVFTSLLITFSRSSYLMFLFSGILLSLLKKSIKLFVVTILLFGILLLGFHIYTILISKPRNIDRTVSAASRLNTWQQGIDIFQKNPVAGIGFNAYRYALIQEGLSNESFANERGGSSNDSSLLYVLATTGILGFISYLFFLFSFCKLGFDNLKSRGVVLISFLAGLLIHSIFNNSLFYPHIMLWIFLLSTLSLQACLPAGRERSDAAISI